MPKILRGQPPKIQNPNPRLRGGERNVVLREPSWYANFPSHIFYIQGHSLDHYTTYFKLYVFDKPSCCCQNRQCCLKNT